MVRRGLEAILLSALLQTSSAAVPPLQEHVSWSIWHEGCEVYDNDMVAAGTPQLRPAAILRTCYLSAERHNNEASQILTTASDAALGAATRAAIDLIPKNLNLNANFEWAAIHEHQLTAFVRLDAVHQYRAIRIIYRDVQLHNPNARNLLAAVSNDAIHQLVSSTVTANPSFSRDQQAFSRHAADGVIIINPQALTPKTADSLQLTLAEIAPLNRWTQATLTSSKDLATITQEYYGAKDKPASTDLTKLISDANTVDAYSKLPVGQTITLPPVPSLGTTKAQKEQPQVIDLDSNSLVGGKRAGGLPQQSSIKKKTSGSTWLLTAPREVFLAFEQSLPSNARSELLASSYQGVTDETGNLILLDQYNSAEGPTERPPAPVDAAPTLAMPTGFTTADKLYVLDFFDNTGQPPGQCAHGQKVLEVVKQTLASANAIQLYSNVVGVELDYFRHQSAQDHYLIDYIAKQKPMIRQTLAQIHDVLRKRDLSTVGAFETPLLYLQAIYDAVLSDTNASAVTSSFYTESAGFSLLPSKFNSSNSFITLSAVDDNPGYIEEFPLEPIRSLYSARHDDGVLLVGGLVAGTPYGMTSSHGDGVSLLGRGDGWGDGSTCIQPSDKGTSFAAPQVAILAFLTRALWKVQNTALTPLQLRDRLLRSTPVSWTSPPGYSAPGMPNSLWATTGKFGTLIYASGNPASISGLSGSVTYSNLTAPGTFTIPVQAANGGVSGIQHSGSDFLIFDSTQQRWIKVNLQNVQLNITLTNGQSLQVPTLKEFTDQLSAVTLF